MSAQRDTQRMAAYRVQTEALHELLQLSSHSIVSLRHQNSLLSARQATLQASHALDTALIKTLAKASSCCTPSQAPQTALQAQCASLRTQLADSNTRTTEVQNSLQIAHAQIKELQEKLTSRSAKVDALAKRRVEDQRVINTLKETQQRLTTQVQQLQQQLQKSSQATAPALVNDGRLLSPAPLAAASPSESRSRYTDTSPFEEDGAVDVELGELQRVLVEHAPRSDQARSPKADTPKRKRVVSVTAPRRSPRQTVAAARAKIQRPPKRNVRRKTSSSAYCSPKSSVKCSLRPRSTKNSNNKIT